MYRAYLAKYIPVFFVGIFIAALLFSCGDNSEIQKNNYANKVIPSPDIDEILKDTSKVTPIVDSLKKEFYVANDSVRIDILAQLSENWRAFSFPLAQEVLIQSSKNKNTYTEALAYCKYGSASV